MKKQRLTILIALVAVVAACVAAAAVGHSAERKEAEPPTLDAVMRLDVAPLVAKLEKIEAELILLRTTAETTAERMQAMQESFEKAFAQMRPAKYQYHFLYSNSNAAANRLADDGWELVTSGKDNLLIFRRAAPEKEEKEAQP